MADNDDIPDPERDEAARIAAVAFARQLVPLWQAALGTELLGVYLIGSLAHAGFNRRYSDIDLAVITQAGIAAPAIEGMRRETTALSAQWGPKVSLFWTDRRFSVGRFPPLDRIDYLDRPFVLFERERLTPPRPTVAEIRHYLGGAPFAGWAENAGRFAAAATLDPKDRKSYLRALLYPARFCYSYVTGQMASNDDAVAFLKEKPLRGLDVGLTERALQCRQAAADPDALFPARTALPAQVAACAALLGER
jgi:hypothetical protein